MPPSMLVAALSTLKNFNSIHALLKAAFGATNSSGRAAMASPDSSMGNANKELSRKAVDCIRNEDAVKSDVVSWGPVSTTKQSSTGSSVGKCLSPAIGDSTDFLSCDYICAVDVLRGAESRKLIGRKVTGPAIKLVKEAARHGLRGGTVN